jgi:4,5-dihydroxyphthalate decarboxylase
MIEESVEIMGEDWWPYGIDKNRIVIDKFTEYHCQQGLSSRKLSIEEMFVPETLSEFKI